MGDEASADIGTSGALSEDINNPCRESELRKLYDKFKAHKLPEYRLKIKEKSKSDKTIDLAEEKEKLNVMLQKVFTEAQHDMTKKKEDFLSFFQVSHNGDAKNTKKSKYLELAVQNLQMIIFYEEVSIFQNVHKLLGYREPDPFWKLADSWYKLGCLMTLHNPPLLLDWENKKSKDILPDIMTEERSEKTALQI